MKRKNKQWRLPLCSSLCSLSLFLVGCSQHDCRQKESSAKLACPVEIGKEIPIKIQPLVLKDQLIGANVIEQLGEPYSIVDGLPSGILYLLNGELYLFEVKFPETAESPFGAPIEKRNIESIYNIPDPQNLSKRTAIWMPK